MGGVDGALAAGLTGGQLQRRATPGRQALGVGPGQAAAHDTLQNVGDHLVTKALLLQGAGSHAALLPQQAQQQVLGADVAMAHLGGRLVGKLHGGLGLGGETNIRHNGNLLFKSGKKRQRRFLPMGWQATPRTRIRSHTAWPER